MKDRMARGRTPTISRPLPAKALVWVGQAQTFALAAAVSRATFPSHYCWYIFVCALDLILTNTVIATFGAAEVNVIANHFLQAGGFWGMICFKVATMLVVIGVIEIIARCERHATAHRLAEWAIVLSGIPVVCTLAQIAMHR